MDDTPNALGNKHVLEQLFQHAELDSIDISQYQGTARFESIESWIYTGAKGWTEDEALSNTELKELIEVAEQELSQFKTSLNTVAFPTSAYIISGIKR